MGVIEFWIKMFDPHGKVCLVLFPDRAREGGHAAENDQRDQKNAGRHVDSHGGKAKKAQRQEGVEGRR